MSIRCQPKNFSPLCLASPLKISNQLYLETAEGIDIQLTPAGLGVRTLAFTFDLLIRSVIFALAWMGLSAAGDFGMGLLLILIFFIEWFYPVVFEITSGATPGKKAYGLVVVYDNGLPVTFPGSLIRNLFRTIDILPAAYVLGAVALVLSDKSKRVGDYLAGTMVVYKEAPIEFEQMNVEKAQTIDLVLTTEQQQAIVEFAQRSKHLSIQRQQELANILTPITGLSGDEGVVKLKSIAASLVGQS